MTIELKLVFPHFHRPNGEPGPCVPPDAEFFNDLRTMGATALREVGCRPWNDPASPDPEDQARFGGKALWLFPAEWYPHIPEGYALVCLNGEREAFKAGVTDDDMRFGLLAYGILVNE